jgi:hypothetical protein
MPAARRRERLGGAGGRSGARRSRSRRGSSLLPHPVRLPLGCSRRSARTSAPPGRTRRRAPEGDRTRASPVAAVIAPASSSSAAARPSRRRSRALGGSGARGAARAASAASPTLRPSPRRPTNMAWATVDRLPAHGARSRQASSRSDRDGNGGSRCGLRRASVSSPEHGGTIPRRSEPRGAGRSAAPRARSAWPALPYCSRRAGQVLACADIARMAWDIGDEVEQELLAGARGRPQGGGALSLTHAPMTDAHLGARASVAS